MPDLRSWTVLACWPDDAQWAQALDAPGPWRGAAEAWSVLLAAGATHDLPAEALWADGYTEPPFGPAHDATTGTGRLPLARRPLHVLPVVQRAGCSGVGVRTGTHARAMQDHLAGTHVVRGSFTTFSVVDTRGTWSDRDAFQRTA